MRIARSKCLPMPWTRAGVRLIPEGHSANRSLSAIEPVSATAKRKLENGEQRPAPETRPSRTEMPKIAGQRQGFASVTRGNVAGSHTPGNNTTETGLPGWGGRIRTSAWRNQNPLPYRLATPQCRFYPRPPAAAGPYCAAGQAATAVGGINEDNNGRTIQPRPAAVKARTMIYLASTLYQVLMIMTGRPSLWSRWT
jgi:hypothetical protein